MSDMSRSNKKTSEKNLASRFTSYLFAFALFFGAHLLYRTDGPAFDYLAGLMFAIFIYTVTHSVKRAINKKDAALEQIIGYRKAQYKMRNIFKGGNIWFWLIPIFILPFLLYQNGFPIELIKFGSAFFVGFIGIYLNDMRSSLAFYKQMDKHINWVSIENEVYGEHQ